MKILFDSNLWISFMIGKRLSSLAVVLCRHDVEVYISGDKDLTDLKEHAGIPILTYNELLNKLNS